MAGRNVGFALVLVMVAQAWAATSSPAQASTFGALDRAIVKAISAEPGPDAIGRLGDANKQLEQIFRERQGGKATDLDVTVRANVIDAMRDVIALDMQKSTLESVRAQVRTLDLVRTLADAAAVGQAEKSADLDALVFAVYDRLVATGRGDDNAAIKFGVPDGESLVYRVFVVADGGALSAFELTGNRPARRATWRETVLARRSSGLLGKAATVYGAADAKKGAFPASTHPFVLVLSGSVGDIDPEAEAALERSLAPLTAEAIVPLVIEADTRALPFTRVPAIPASADARAGLAGAAAALIHRRSGAMLASWSDAGRRDLAHILKSTAALAREVAADLGVSGSAITKDAGENVFGAVIAAPRALPKGEKPAMVSVIEDTKAAAVGADEWLKLSSAVPMKLRATLPGTEWGQYAIVGDAGDRLVWLKRVQVAAYVPPRNDELEPAAGGTSDAGAPKSSAAKGSKGQGEAARISSPPRHQLSADKPGKEAQP